MDEARRKMIEKRFGGNVNGASIGDGGMRRKKKGNPKSVGDDKKLGGVLKKLNLQDLKGVEEVNIFMTNDDVIHITQPKIQASIPCNTYVVSGNSEKKKLAELLPDIVTQLGPEQMATLRRYAESTIGAGAAAAGAAGEEEEEEDDDVPELVENFEEAANK